MTEWYVITQVFQTLGLAGFLASIVLLSMYAIFPEWRKKQVALSSLIAISYLSGKYQSTCVLMLWIMSIIH